MQWIVPGFVAFFGVVQNSPRTQTNRWEARGTMSEQENAFLRKGKERNKEGIEERQLGREEKERDHQIWEIQDEMMMMMMQKEATSHKRRNIYRYACTNILWKEIDEIEVWEEIFSYFDGILGFSLFFWKISHLIVADNEKS